MRSLHLLALSWAVVACDKPDDAARDTDDTDAGLELWATAGPGLGNLTYADSELFTPIGWIDNDNGVPAPTPDIPITQAKPFGTNVAYLFDGYLVTVFAPDSGFGPGGLLIYDVSDPREPTLVTRVWEPDEATGRTWDFREAHAMAFSRQDGRKLLALHTGLGAQIWDLTDVTDPQRVGEIDLPGVYFGDYELVAWQLAWQGTHLYVAGAGQGLFVVDTSDPDHLVLADRGGAPNPIPPSELGGFRIGPLFTVGNRLIVSSMDNTAGYALLDLSDPRHPALLGTRTGLDKFYATCFGGGRVIASVRGGGALMTVDDVQDPFTPRWLSTDLEIDKQLYCATQDQFVFQGGEDELVKVDLSDPTRPVIVGRGSLDRPDTDHGQVSPFGNLVFVGNDHGTGSAFMVHDTAPDTTPPAIDFVSPEDGAQAEGVLTRVGVTFTDMVQDGSVRPDTFVVRPSGGDPIPGLYTVQGHIVNFEPAEPLRADTEYVLEVPAGGVLDYAGNPTAEAFTSRFRTADVDPDLQAGLAVAIDAPAQVEVGTPVTLQLDVTGSAQGHASWRFAEATPWKHNDDLSPETFTFDQPGHHTVIVTVTNGVRRVSTTHQITVHRPLPAKPPVSSHTLAHDAARGLVWTVNRDQDSVSALQDDDLSLVHEIPVDAGPRSVAIAPDGTVWVSCEGSGTVVLIDGDEGSVADRILLHPGAAPTGLVVTEARGEVFVALHGTGEIVGFDAEDGVEVARLSVGPKPFGLSVTGDGSTLYATRKTATNDGAFVYEVAGDLSSSTTWTIHPDTTTTDGEDRARGVPNILLTPGLTPDLAELWLPATQANVLRGVFRDGQTLTHETTIRATVPRLDARTGVERPGPRLDLNDRAPGVDVAFSPLGDYAFLALQGNHRVAVHDAYTGEPLGAWQGEHTVQGVIVSDDGQSLYAHHLLSRSVTRHALADVLARSSYTLPAVATGATITTEALDPVVLRGKRVFHDAEDDRMSKDNYVSCAHCHPDGADDGLVWDFTGRGEGLRNTIDLRGRAGMAHGPVHWTGNFDEIQDFENDIRNGQGGRGFLRDADWSAGTTSDPLGAPKAGLSVDLDALAAYVSSLTDYPPSPHRTLDGALTEAAARGETLYDDLACADCHGGTHLTSSALDDRHDVGTLTAASGSRRGGPLDGLDVPTLRGLHATAPYLHDGRAPTVRDVFASHNADDEHGVTSPLTDEALDDLAAYLLSLD